MKSASAEAQLPLACDGVAGPRLRQATNAHNIAAPDSSRRLVKLAASMPPPRSAYRHSSELPAKASRASAVSSARRGVGIRRAVGPVALPVKLHRSPLLRALHDQAPLRPRPPRPAAHPDFRLALVAVAALPGPDRRPGRLRDPLHQGALSPRLAL